MNHSILARTHLGLGACSIRQKCWLERVKILSINQSLKGAQHQTVLLLQAMFAATTKTTAVGGHRKTRDFSQRETLLLHSTVKSFFEFRFYAMSI